MSEFGDIRDRLIMEHGQAHCPIDDCDWWVPAGMEYGFFDHIDKHDELQR